MIYSIFIVIHVLICILMVVGILMQASKGKGLAGAFGGAGGMASGILGARGTATFLSKATTYLSVAFFVNCIILSLLSRTIIAQRSAVQEATSEYQSPAQNLPMVPGTLDQGLQGVEFPEQTGGTIPETAPVDAGETAEPVDGQ